jgi:hypothetical protein
LAEQGVRTLRYPAAEVLGNLDGVVRQIVAVAVDRRANNSMRRRPPPPSPSAPPPPGGGG